MEELSYSYTRKKEPGKEEKKERKEGRKEGGGRNKREGGAEKCISRSGSNKILPRNLKPGMLVRLFSPCEPLSAHTF